MVQRLDMRLQAGPAAKAAFPGDDELRMRELYPCRRPVGQVPAEPLEGHPVTSPGGAQQLLGALALLLQVQAAVEDERTALVSDQTRPFFLGL